MCGGKSQRKKRFRIPRNHFQIAASPMIQKLAQMPISVPRTIASMISFNNSIVIIIYHPFLCVDGSSAAALISVIYLREKVIIFLSAEIILSSGLSAERFAVRDLLQVIQTTGNPTVAVAVESIQADGGPAINTGIYFTAL